MNEDFDDLIDYTKTVDRSQFYKWKEVVKKDPSRFCKSCIKAKEEPWCNVVKKVDFVYIYFEYTAHHILEYKTLEIL